MKGNGVFALVCPDWRNSALVIDGRSGRVAYANWKCLRLLEQEGPIRLVAGRLSLDPNEFDRRFFIQLEKTFSGGVGSSAVIFHDEQHNTWFSATIHIAQGFARSILANFLGGETEASQIAVVEFATSRDFPAPFAVGAFARAIALTPAEQQLIWDLVRGRSTGEIAIARGVSLSTIRQRKKALFAKAHCSRQSEFVNLVRTLCPTHAEGGELPISGSVRKFNSLDT